MFPFSIYALKVSRVEGELGPIECAIHNIGANIGNVSIFDTTTRVYTKVTSGKPNCIIYRKSQIR